MNRKEIIKELKKYNLDPKKYIVISGAAMVLYGFKDETPDIDISVTKEYKKELSKLKEEGDTLYVSTTGTHSE